MRIKGKGKSILTRQRLPVLGLFEGLLDQVSGAAAAYSIRLLRAGYSGGLVRVRAVDSSGVDQGEADVLPDGNNEISLSSSLTNRDSTAGSSGRDVNTLGELVDNGGANYDGFVSEWKDQSLNAYHAANSTASEQPQLVSAGILIKENGKPTLDFDGTDDYLDLGYTFADSTSSYTFIALHNANSNSNGYIADFENGRLLFVPIDSYTYFDGNTTAGPAITTNSQVLLELFLDKSNTRGDVYENGSQTGSNLSYSPVSLQGQSKIGTKFNDGLGKYADIKFQEFIIYDKNNISERSKFESNINESYQIPNF